MVCGCFLQLRFYVNCGMLRDDFHIVRFVSKQTSFFATFDTKNDKIIGLFFICNICIIKQDSKQDNK